MGLLPRYPCLRIPCGVFEGRVASPGMQALLPLPRILSPVLPLLRRVRAARRARVAGGLAAAVLALAGNSRSACGEPSAFPAFDEYRAILWTGDSAYKDRSRL